MAAALGGLWNSASSFVGNILNPDPQGNVQRVAYKVDSNALRIFEKIQESYPSHFQKLEELLGRITGLKETLDRRNEELASNQSRKIASLLKKRLTFAQELLDIKTEYTPEKAFLGQMQKNLQDFQSLKEPYEDGRALGSLKITNPDLAASVEAEIDSWQKNIQTLKELIPKFSEVQQQCRMTRLIDHTFGKFCCLVSVIENKNDPSDFVIQRTDQLKRYLGSLFGEHLDLQKVIQLGEGDDS